MIRAGLRAAALAAALAACSGRDSEPAPRPPAAPEPEPEPSPEPTPSWRTIDPPAAPGSLGASLTATDDGVLATWIEPRGEDAHAVRFARLRGDTWSGARTVVEADDLIANWADFPRAAAHPGGGVLVSYPRRAGDAPYAYAVHLSRSRDDGAFEPLGVVHRDGTPTEHGFVSMVPQGDGLRLFWLDGRATLGEGGATAVYTATVGDAIGEETRVDERACDCCQTDAAVGPDGPLVVFRDRSEAEVRDVSIVRAGEGGFGAASPVHADGWEIAGCPVNGPAIDADGQRVAVAWFTGADGGSARIAFSADGGASFGAPIRFDPDQPPGRVGVALVDGGAAVSWLARASEAGEVRVRFVGDDGELGASTRVAPTATARASGFPVLARDGERLVIAYRDGGDPARVHAAWLPVSALPRRGEDAAPDRIPAPVEVGERAPAGHLRDAEDTRVTLASLREGAPSVVAFFARWCQPCREELASLERLRERLGDRARVIAVSLDEGPAARAEATARRWGFTGRVLRDDGAAGALGAPPLPATFMLDEAGTLRAAWRGELFDEEELARRAVTPRPDGPAPGGAP